MRYLRGFALSLLAALTATAADNLTQAEHDQGSLKGWPAGVREIQYPSRADQTTQPALFYAPATGEPRPLLVALHSWSANYRQTSQVPMARWSIEKGWVFIHPNFRGPNKRPDATGSELVVQDILSAVEYAKRTAKVDTSRVYLVGGSGGGYASLLLAGRAPEVWTAVSAWVPITDLKAWYFESIRKKQKYADDIVKSVGGIPNDGTPAEAECRQRSVVTYLARAKGLPLDINAGIHDGHRGSVPISHALNAFNLVAAPADRITPDAITWFVEKEQVPPSLAAGAADDPTYGAKKVLFRRQSGQVRVTIFEGGHELLPEAALAWLEKQRRKN